MLYNTKTMGMEKLAVCNLIKIFGDFVNLLYPVDVYSGDFLRNWSSVRCVCKNGNSLLVL